MKRLWVLLVWLWLVPLAMAQQPVPTSPPGSLTASDDYLRNPRLGIAHISAAEGGTPDERYRTALSLGASWNRWPIYWDRVETAPGEYDWSRFDRQVVDDIGYGLSINAILLGRPAFYADGDRIQGIQEPIFADGSDVPEAGKAFNPENPWVTFAYEAVMRYKPGGTLSQEGLLGADEGIVIWEIWNEPDHKPFWSASIADYARLLKISYIVIKMADPEAQVMFGGLLFSTPNNWLAQVLNIYINDPLREQYNWYMDIVAVHNYANPWRTGWLVLNIEQTLIAYEIEKPIWITETGIPVWDDYPGPTWTEEAEDRPSFGTMQQQAWFVIQSAAYAWQEGAEIIIFHQLYDDCGDKPAGTNFKPHNGDLCIFNENCYGDAHGFYRNISSSVCFSQHPEPGTPRPAANAYRLLAQVFAEPFEQGEILELTDVTGEIVMQFRRINRDERVLVMWNQTFEPVTVTIPAEGLNAQFIRLESESLLTPDNDGNYVITLPAAQPDNYPEPPFGADAAVGGEPFILIERTESRIEPFVRYEPPTSAGQISISSVSTPAPTLPPRPTIDPANDTRAPETRMNPLPVVSAPQFTVSWSASDDSGIAQYVVWVRADEGEWEKWLETSETSAEFSGVRGTRYAFDVWAQDLAGNWSQNFDLMPRAVTRIED